MKEQRFGKKIEILVFAFLIAMVSCSFTSTTFNDPNKDKLLLKIISHVLNKYHYSPKDLDDTFSKNIYDDYLSILDPFKRYFYKSDLKEFKKYETQIDDQLQESNLEFFNVTYTRLLERIKESKEIYTEILKSPFDFSANETIETNYEEWEYVKNKKQMKERWRKILKYYTLDNYYDLLNNNDSESDNKTTENVIPIHNLTEIEVEARGETLENLDDLYAIIDERRREEWFSVFVNSIVDEFDPHTYYFAPIDKERFDVSMSGNFEGIGARLYKKRASVVVSDIISGGPAWRQNGLEVGDHIIKVRQEEEEIPTSIVGMRLDDAIKLIKGPKGTKVILTLKKVDGTIEDIEIERDVVELEETYAKSSVVDIEGKKFGVIHLPKFYISFKNQKERNAATDIKLEIERLKEQNIEGIVFDVRGNGGGSLKTVVDIAGMFIEKGPIVQVKSFEEDKEVLKDKDKSIIWDGPLVILVNELSASASEILAAAMQDYKRAIIIGSKQTYGKGTVQNVFDLNRGLRNNTHGDLGALKFTTQKFYRINGGSTQLEGVKSDIVIPDRYSYIDIGEKDQENPLPYDEISSVKHAYWDSPNYESAIQSSKKRMQANSYLNLIDENAKWLKTIQDKTEFTLNYEAYKKDLDIANQKSETFKELNEYTSNLTFSSLPYEEILFETDTILKQKRERWHSNLSKDIYITEALHVLRDLQNTTKINTKIASQIQD